MSNDQELPHNVPNVPNVPNVSTGAAYWPHATPFNAPPAALTETLEAEFNIAQMRALAKVWDIRLKGSSRSGFVEQVAQALADRVARMREDPTVLLADLTAEQALFARKLLTARDHELPLPRSLAATLRVPLGSLPEPAADKKPLPAQQDRSLAEMLDSLRRRALIFPTHRYVGYRDVYYQWLPLAASGGNVPVVTWEIGAHTPDERRAAQEETPVLTDRPSGLRTPDSGPNFLDSFDLFLNAILSTGVDVRPSMPAHAQSASVVWLRGWEHHAGEADRLLNSRPGWAPDPRSGVGVPLLSPLSPQAKVRLESQTGLPVPRCEFLFALATALQLIEAPDPYADINANATGRRSGLSYRLDAAWHLNARRSAIEEWFALTDEQRLLRAWNAWQSQLAEGVETGRALHLGVQVVRAIGTRDLGPLDLAAEWCALRRYVARTLRGLPPNQWIDWPEFSRLLFDFYPDCAWALYSQDHWWFAAKGGMRRLNTDQFEDWSASIGAIIETILIESLQWFGMVEVEVEADAPDQRRLRAFRVTGLGEWIVQARVAQTGGSSDPLPRLPQAAASQPRITEPVTWLDDRRWRLPPAPDRAEFISFARKIGRPSQEPFVYALNPASVESALQDGISLEEAAAQFARFEAPMPAAAQDLFRATAERFGRIRVYEALTVLQFSDDYALPELLASTPLAQAIVYHLSPRAVVVRPEVVDALMREMVERGYTPTEKT